MTAPSPCQGPKPNVPRIAPCVAADCRACEFRGLTFCDGLCEEEVGELSAMVSRLRVQPQQKEFQEGDPAEHVFNVTSGVVKLYKLLLDSRRQITGFCCLAIFLDSPATTASSCPAPL